MTEEQLAYIEEVGMVVAGFGLPRMAGRVLGALLMADPPEQSAEALAETLQASRGSISTSTRMLEAWGLIDRVSVPGERKDYFRNRPGAWMEAMRRETEAIRRLRQLAEKGLALLGSDDPEVRRGLEDMRDFYVYWEEAFPAVLERWERDMMRMKRGMNQGPTGTRDREG